MAWPILAVFPIIVLATYVGRHVAMKVSKNIQNYIVLGVMLIALVSLISSFFK